MSRDMRMDDGGAGEEGEGQTQQFIFITYFENFSIDQGTNGPLTVNLNLSAVRTCPGLAFESWGIFDDAVLIDFFFEHFM